MGATEAVHGNLTACGVSPNIEIIDHRAIDGLFMQVIYHNRTELLRQWKDAQQPLAQLFRDTEYYTVNL